MQRNNTPVLLITIVLGVLALGATAFLLLRPSTPVPAVQTAAVPTPTPAERWVATRNIPPRTVVDSTMLRKEAQKGAVPADAITSIDDIRGELTSAPINMGETVTKGSFTNALQRQVPANIPIPSGMRGVAIWVDPNQTAAGLVDVGDRVDVVATHKLTWDKGPNQHVLGAVQFTTGRTIAQNLLVLAVDKSIQAPAPTPTPAPGVAPAPPAAPTPVPPPAATPRTRVLLAATPEVAAHLIAANDQGVLHITIRNPIDGDQGLVPQAIEYPSSVYTINATPKPVERTTSGPAVGPMPQMPVAQQVPTMAPVKEFPTANLTPLPAEPATKEITVIRGTEKTRVIVPQR